MNHRKRRPQRMRRRGDDESGILSANMPGLAGLGFRQMHAMSADAASQCRVIRNQQDQTALAGDSAQSEGTFGARFGVTGADNHQAGPRQGIGGGPGIGQAGIIGQQHQHARVEGTRRSC